MKSLVKGAFTSTNSSIEEPKKPLIDEEQKKLIDQAVLNSLVGSLPALSQ